MAVRSPPLLPNSISVDRRFTNSWRNLGLGSLDRRTSSKMVLERSLRGTTARENPLEPSERLTFFYSQLLAMKKCQKKPAFFWGRYRSYSQALRGVARGSCVIVFPTPFSGDR